MLGSKKNSLTISILSRLKQKGMPKNDSPIQDIALINDSEDASPPEEEADTTDPQTPPPESNDLIPLEARLKPKRKPKAY